MSGTNAGGVAERVVSKRCRGFEQHPLFAHTARAKAADNWLIFVDKFYNFCTQSAQFETLYRGCSSKTVRYT